MEFTGWYLSRGSCGRKGGGTSMYTDLRVEIYLGDKSKKENNKTTWIVLRKYLSGQVYGWLLSKLRKFEKIWLMQELNGILNTNILHSHTLCLFLVLPFCWCWRQHWQKATLKTNTKCHRVKEWKLSVWEKLHLLEQLHIKYCLFSRCRIIQKASEFPASTTNPCRTQRPFRKAGLSVCCRVIWRSRYLRKDRITSKVHRKRRSILRAVESELYWSVHKCRFDCTSRFVLHTCKANRHHLWGKWGRRWHGRHQNGNQRGNFSWEVTHVATQEA